MSKRQSLGQERATQAWKDVKDVADTQDDKLKKKYSSLARKMPALLQTNGLGQMLAFLRAKGGPQYDSKEHWRLYRHLSYWVLGKLGEVQTDSLLDWVIKQDTNVYRRATAETMAYLGWLKRFAEALLPVPDANEEDRDG